MLAGGSEVSDSNRELRVEISDGVMCKWAMFTAEANTCFYINVTSIEYGVQNGGCNIYKLFPLAIPTPKLMAETFIDLLTPPGSPEPPDAPTQHIDPIEPAPAVEQPSGKQTVQVEPIQQPVVDQQPDAAETVEPVQMATMHPKKKVYVLVVFASDWGEEDSVLDIRKRLGETFAGGDEAYVVVFRTYKKGQGLKYLFPSKKNIFPGIPEDALTVLVIAAHSAPYQPTQKSASAMDPRQYLSFCSEPAAVQFVSFIDVAKAINQTELTFDIIILACCQGHLLITLPKILRSLKDNGIILYFGDETESIHDGVAALVGELLVEEVLSYIRVENDKGNRVDVKVMFETIYTDLGLEYLGPKKDLYQKNAAGEHIYAEFILHMSCEKAKKLENFVQDFTFAGNLHTHRPGGGNDLVNDILQELRTKYMERQQRKIDLKYELDNPSGGAGCAASSGGAV